MNIHDVMSMKTTLPLYPSKDFKSYVAYQKRKGLMRRYWKGLPAMWEQELKFRREFESSLNELSERPS